ncbi:hypothetical protein IU469_32340 [Nocardia puris]|uniref:hypothetical protein n=1 Tax=Nocardia puris TaxID=208602 RepID=UPI0018930686|nr:hypothetical protein [Nocardia puris]MBF6370357.1 hypothetical protein [Nocardia puris]
MITTENTLDERWIATMPGARVMWRALDSEVFRPEEYAFPAPVRLLTQLRLACHLQVGMTSSFESGSAGPGGAEIAAGTGAECEISVLVGEIDDFVAGMVRDLGVDSRRGSPQRDSIGQVLARHIGLYARSVRLGEHLDPGHRHAGELLMQARQYERLLTEAVLGRIRLPARKARTVPSAHPDHRVGTAHNDAQAQPVADDARRPPAVAGSGLPARSGNAAAW